VAAAISQNDLRIHFGLSRKERSDEVDIPWPAGEKEMLNDLAADQFYRVREGEGFR
jgi:hypothetical protein